MITLKPKLQYQLSNGSWVDCNDRTDEFLKLCRKHNGFDKNNKPIAKFSSVSEANLNQIITMLNDGHVLLNDNSGDWYDKCRIKPTQTLNVAPVLKKTCTDCGQMGNAGNYPFSTIAHGNVCDDCL